MYNYTVTRTHSKEVQPIGLLSISLKSQRRAEDLAKHTHTKTYLKKHTHFLVWWWSKWLIDINELVEEQKIKRKHSVQKSN